MSQIFNIVEELEKERKKNKELEDRIDKILELTEFALNSTYLNITIFYQDIKNILKGSGNNE